MEKFRAGIACELRNATDGNAGAVKFELREYWLIMEGSLEGMGGMGMEFDSGYCEYWELSDREDDAFLNLAWCE